LSPELIQYISREYSPDGWECDNNPEINNTMTARFTLSGDSVRTVIEFEAGQSSGTGGGFPRYGASNPERIEASDTIVTVSFRFRPSGQAKHMKNSDSPYSTGSPAQGRKNGRTDEKRC
jgi:hypothetical protein